MLQEKAPDAVESYRMELEGERAEEHPKKFTKILVRHVVSGECIRRRPWSEP